MGRQNIGSDICALLVVRTLPEQRGAIIFRALILARGPMTGHEELFDQCPMLKGTSQKPCSAGKTCYCLFADRSLSNARFWRKADLQLRSGRLSATSGLLPRSKQKNLRSPCWRGQVMNDRAPCRLGRISLAAGPRHWPAAGLIGRSCSQVSVYVATFFDKEPHKVRLTGQSRKLRGFKSPNIR